MSPAVQIPAKNNVPPALGRVARRRADVRGRLLAVAEQLIDERGLDNVTIDDITEAAGIARRSFYHHFPAKHDVLIPMARARADRLHARIDRLVATVSDPAEVMSTAIRHAIRELSTDPLCRWFVAHSGLPQQRLFEGMSESGMRDMQRGIEAGRFSGANTNVIRALVSGAFLATVSERAQGRLNDEDVDDAVEYLLRMLGIDDDEATAIAHQPLLRLPRSRETD
ncbi:MAG: AcrR family transcriptional regulator [Hyphomicrobiaceae bacterium]